MTSLVLKDLRHHARVWIWSLLVAVTGATFIDLIVITWWSARQWSLAQPDPAAPLAATSIIGSNLVGYVGLATAVVIASTLGLTVAAQQRSHALWKVLGIPGGSIRRIVTAQVALVGLVGGAVGSLIAWATAGWYLVSWRDFDLYPADMPVVAPLFAPVLTMALTALCCVLGGRGAATRAGAVPEMQALREATAGPARTRVWQWLLAVMLLVSVVMAPVAPFLPDEVLLDGESDPQRVAELELIRAPGGRATFGGAMGMFVAMAALCVPRWTLQPLLSAWTRLVPSQHLPAWFAARASAVHRCAMSMTTTVPFALAVAMTGTVYATVGAGQSLGMTDSVNGFLVVAVPIFIVSAVGGVANIAMVGSTRRQEGALLGVLGASEGAVLRATVLEGAIYAVTGVLFGLAATVVSATGAALLSGGGGATFLSAVPWGVMAPVIVVSLLLAVTTTWLPAAWDRRPALERLRQPV